LSKLNLKSNIGEISIVHTLKTFAFLMLQQSLFHDLFYSTQISKRNVHQLSFGENIIAFRTAAAIVSFEWRFVLGFEMYLVM
jgi:hypothetical protein